MRTVLLFRHGKSDWGASYGHDHERPLAVRGRKASAAMGRWITAQGLAPGRILCSTATRTRQTHAIAAVAGGWEAHVTYHESLYGALSTTILELAQELPDMVSVVMFVGHQPTCSVTTTLLSGSQCTHFPTAAIACIDFAVTSWADVAFGAGTLRWVQRPKELPPPE